MTLASALNASLSGLGVTARRAEVVSTNIANAATEGYARRSLSVVSATGAPGVRIAATERHVETAILGEVRLARADAAGNALLARQIGRLEAAYGKAGTADGVAGSVDRLSNALTTAAAGPASEAALAEVADSASALARQFARASSTVQTIRAEADKQIAADVLTLSSGLAEVGILDRQIASLGASGQDVSSLLDQRQARITALSSIVPIREVTRQDGGTMLVTPGGAVLLDRGAAVFEFTATPTISADRTAPLANLLLDGRPSDTSPDGPLSGGTLSAAFELRDRITTGLQSDLDQLALSIESRLRQADATLPAGMPGLLADDGRAADASRTDGLSTRLDLNVAVDFDLGGALWKLRSGLGSAQPGPTGESRHLLSLKTALQAIPVATAQLSDSLAQKRVAAEDRSATAAARAATFDGQLSATGVNTDAELQNLMQIERAFAANAQVLRAVDDMLQVLLER